MTAIGSVLDCKDPETLPGFWASAPGYDRIGAAGQYVPPPAARARRPEVLEPGGLGVDIETSDIDAEATRLEHLGARRVTRDAHAEHGSYWHVMADPEGNEFCVCDVGGAG